MHVLLVLLVTYAFAQPIAKIDDSTLEDEGVESKFGKFQQQMNATFSRLISEVTNNLQRFNVTSLAKQLAQARPSEPKLTFEGVSRLEIPLGNSFEIFKQMAEKLPGLNLLHP